MVVTFNNKTNVIYYDLHRQEKINKSNQYKNIKKNIKQYILQSTIGRRVHIRHKKKRIKNHYKEFNLFDGDKNSQKIVKNFNIIHI